MTKRRNAAGRSRNSELIPPPPDPDKEGYDAVIAYFDKYSTEELEEAGHLTEASPQHVRKVAASATYQLLCENGLHLKLARKDYARLSRLAARQGVTAEDLVKKWIKERFARASTTKDNRR